MLASCEEARTKSLSVLILVSHEISKLEKEESILNSL